MQSQWSCRQAKRKWPSIAERIGQDGGRKTLYAFSPRIRNLFARAYRYLQWEPPENAGAVQTCGRLCNHERNRKGGECPGRDAPPGGISVASIHRSFWSTLNSLHSEIAKSRSILFFGGALRDVAALAWRLGARTVQRQRWRQRVDRSGKISIRSYALGLMIAHPPRASACAMRPKACSDGFGPDAS